MPGVDLDSVYEQYRNDPAFGHLRTEGIRMVPGYGVTRRPVAMVIGEAPGATENTKGRPFCGPSGRVLNGLMEAAGLRTDARPDWADDGIGNYGGVEWVANAYLTNVVKYRPPGNRTPTAEEIAASVKYLRMEWRSLGRPPVIIPVGATALYALLPDGPGPISHVAGTIIYANNAIIAPQYHPAFGLRRKSLQPTMEEHWEDLGAFMLDKGITGEFGHRMNLVSGFGAR